MALYKQGPKSYQFLKNILPLPSKSTLQQLLSQIPFEPGINKETLGRLSKGVSKLKDLGKTCVPLFDEISLSEQLIYYYEKSNVGRQNEFANHALGFDGAWFM